MRRRTPRQQAQQQARAHKSSLSLSLAPPRACAHTRPHYYYYHQATHKEHVGVRLGKADLVGVRVAKRVLERRRGAHERHEQHLHLFGCCVCVCVC